MALVLADRVRETTTVVGTGPATLLGAIVGYQSFTAVGNGNTTYYVIANQSAGEWEVGVGTYTASGTTLSRDTVLSSSNAGALVNFSAGTKDIWVDYAAGKAVTTDTLAYPPVIGDTTPNAATFTTLTSNGLTTLTNGSGSLIIDDGGGSIANFRLIGPTAALGRTRLYSPNQLRISTATTNTINFYTGASSTPSGDGVLQLQVSNTTSAVNYVQVTGAATGGTTVVSSQGSDASVNLGVAAKGSGVVRLFTGGTTEQFRVLNTASAVNFATATGSSAGNAISFSVAGTDTNISQVFQSKGTGAIDLAAGSSGVNISNGGTVTAITYLAGGANWTSAPTVAISAPTTAGGVQATATIPIMVQAATVFNGGTGYTVNDVLTVVGGTFATAATLTVTAVSAGVITAVSTAGFGRGNYTVFPTNPASVTGGTGSGATFTLTSSVANNVAFTITNAGSGYVEQPTVTFSGGGGSGATAFATIGAATSLKSLNDMTVNLPSGPVLSMTDSSLPGTGAYLNLSNGSTSSVISRAAGTNTNLNFYWLTKGTGLHSFNTNNSTTTQQMVVSHTASAVNYVQVTGSVTSPGAASIPTIGVQGSDASTYLGIGVKGTGGYISFYNGGAPSVTTTLFRVLNTAGTLANFIGVSAATSTNSPFISANGTDTNIDLALTPKGTGTVVANGPFTATGQTSLGGAPDSESLRVLSPTSTGTYIQAAGGLSQAEFRVGGTQSNNSFYLVSRGTGVIGFSTNNSVSNIQMRVSNTASAVNYVQVTGAATALRPTISAQGSDSSIALDIQAKGTAGYVNIDSFRANYLRVQGSSTTGGIATLSTQGVDTNIDLALTPKGTGTVIVNGPLTIPTASGNAVISPNTSITSWLYSGKSFSVGGQETAPTGLFIGADGTKMYVNGTTGDDVNEYTLGTAWDVTTATFVTVFSTAAQDSAPVDLFFNPDGLSMYVLGDTNNSVHQYTLTTAWSVATASYASKLFSVATQETSPSGLWFKPDGTEMYITGGGTDTIWQYTLSTAWDVSTAVYSTKSYSVAAQETVPNQVNLSADGLQMYVLGGVGDDIWQYTLGTAWDVSTATPINNFYIGFQDASPTGMFIDSSAVNRVFIGASTTDTVYQYNTATNSAEFNTDKLYAPGALSVNGNFVAGANAYVDGTLAVQGANTFSTSTSILGTLSATSTVQLSGATTSTTSLGTSATTGTMFLGGASQTGLMTIGQSTVSQTTNIQAGATASGSIKTLAIGTAGLSGSTTNINIGSNVSGSLGTTTISAPTVNIGQTATQFAVTNTASAVNYVQVTGAATGGTPTISGQGSDTNINFTVQSKGTGNVVLMDGGGNTGARLLRAATSGDTFIDIQRNVGFVDLIAASGVANGDIRLTPKGTGNVRFGTLTASADVPITGYIEIKDSGGTIRRLAVIG